MFKVQESTGIFLFTTPTLQGYDIQEYYGLVTGCSVYGANFIKDFFANVVDVIGGRAGGYEKVTDASIEAALRAMATKARRQGANAIISIEIDTGAVNSRMLTASCSGTAVLIKPVSKP